MFDNINGWEIAALLLIALFILGPERLPKVISDAARGIRKLRQMARNATAELNREMGTNLRMEDLHPKTFIRKHVLSEEDEAMLRRPFQELYNDMEDIASKTDLRSNGSRRAIPSQQNGHHPTPNFDIDAT
mgnify:CR=1 FL=1